MFDMVFLIAQIRDTIIFKNKYKFFINIDY